MDNQTRVIASEIFFLVEHDLDGGYTARAMGAPIFTEADDMETLRVKVRDAVHCHFPDTGNRPSIVRLHEVRDEVFEVNGESEDYYRVQISKAVTGWIWKGDVDNKEMMANDDGNREPSFLPLPSPTGDGIFSSH